MPVGKVRESGAGYTGGDRQYWDLPATLGDAIAKWRDRRDRLIAARERNGLSGFSAEARVQLAWVGEVLADLERIAEHDET